MSNNIYSAVSSEARREDFSRNMAFRRRHEKPLLNWWFFIFLSIITLGIAGLAIFIIRILRVDMYLQRKQEYYALVAEYTRRRIEHASCTYSEHDIIELSKFSDNFANRVRPIGVFFTLVMSILTLGLFMLFYIYRMNRVWNDAQDEEIRFNTLLSRVWLETGFRNEPLAFRCVGKLARSYILYMFLGIVTCGLWFFVWDYIIHVAPDKLFISVHETENVVARVMLGEPC